MTHPIKGIVHGRVVELAADSGLPDGQEVVVSLQPVDQANAVEALSVNGRFNDALGTWSDDAAELDHYVEWNRSQRKIARSEL